MNNHFVKFAFLVAVIGAVIFSRNVYPTASFASLTQVTSTGEEGSGVPLFVPTTVTAETNIEAPTTIPLRAAPAVSAIASIVADLASGKIIEATNADKRWPTASITKLMTATVALDKLDPAAKVTITEGMFAADPTEQTLVVGGTYTVSDLLSLMLMPSSNVAAEALADFYGRGMFLDEMNARAREWGMANTYFGDPSGLSVANQSTAADFLKLAREVADHYPSIFRITRNAQTVIVEQNSQKAVPVKSINLFAGRPDFIGGKTGHTDEAAGNLLSVFSYGGRNVFIVVLGTNDRFNDTQKLYEWYKASNK